MSRWAFRLLLFYICVLFTQPQNRFLFLYPLHIADICVVGSFGLHCMSAMMEGRPVLRFGPATIAALLLMLFSYFSLYVGAMQTNSAWNSHIDILFKSVIVIIMIEAMAFSVKRAWAVQATVFLATLWWIKGGLRLSMAGATYAGDRIMGPAVGMVENPNGFAYMLCVVLPLYLFFYEYTKKKYIKWAILALAVANIFCILKTGSRTGLVTLGIMGIFLFFRYGKQHKTTLLVSGVAIYFLMPHIGLMNMERFKSIPESIKSFLSGTEELTATMDQDAQSAHERSIKNRHTLQLIMNYPLFGVGINPDESLYPPELWGAAGQVHNEALMAGKQMGFMGIGLYYFFLTLIFRKGRAVQKYAEGWWPAASGLGWTFKMQAVAIFVGGSFSPIPWNAVMFILAGSASAMWLALSEMAPAESTQPSVGRAAPPASPALAKA